MEQGVMLGVIMALAQLTKGTLKGILDPKFIPWVNIALGLLIGALVGTDPSIKNNLIMGLTMGLTACGLYDATLKVARK